MKAKRIFGIAALILLIATFSGPLTWLAVINAAVDGYLIGRWLSAEEMIRHLPTKIIIPIIIILTLPVLSLAQQPCSCETPLPAVTSGVIVKIEPVDQLTYPVLSSPATCQCKPLVTAAITAPLPREQESSTYLAQQPQPLQIVSNCIKGGYDECEFVPPHWYYRVGTVWTRDDGVIGEPPVVPIAPCPFNASQARRQLLNDLDYRGPWPQMKTDESPWNAHFWTSSAVFLGGSFADWASSRGRRELGPLRNSTGGLNSGAYWSLNGGLYTLSVIIQKRHPKGASAIRYIVGTVHFGDAAWNWGGGGGIYLTHQ